MRCVNTNSPREARFGDHVPLLDAPAGARGHRLATSRGRRARGAPRYVRAAAPGSACRSPRVSGCNPSPKGKRPLPTPETARLSRRGAAGVARAAHRRAPSAQWPIRRATECSSPERAATAGKCLRRARGGKGSTKTTEVCRVDNQTNDQGNDSANPSRREGCRKALRELAAPATPPRSVPVWHARVPARGSGRERATRRGLRHAITTN